ncbi:MAG: sigma 54-interacting transcriptional regulator [Cellvibrio sp.]
MISVFQPPKSNKPFAKAVFAFDEQSGAKWVPINKSFIALAKIILQAAAERMEIKTIAVTLRCITHQGYHHLLLANEELETSASALGSVEEFIISNEDSLTPKGKRFSETESVSVPLDYQERRLGYVLASVPEIAESATNRSPRALEAELHIVVSEIGSIITRYQTRYRAIFIYGDQGYWIGNSMALRQLDKRIEQLKDITRPILIRGNKGTGKCIAARSIHCSRHKGILPFIESSCNEWEEGAAASILQALYTYAKGGTLYLRNIDFLSPDNLRILQRFWGSIQGEMAVKGAAESAAMIFSVSRRHYASKSDLSEWLKINTVELLLPDLAERREDLRDLVSFYIRDYTLSVEFDFTDHAWRLLESYSWRENVTQLRQVIQKVALIAEEPLVSVSLLEPLLRD